MFCALKGATRRPRRARSRQKAVAIQLLPALEPVPPIKIAWAGAGEPEFISWMMTRWRGQGEVRPDCPKAVRGTRRDEFRTLNSS